MGQEPLTGRGARLVLALIKGDICARGKGSSLQFAGCLHGFGPRMHPHIAKISLHMRFILRPVGRIRHSSVVLTTAVGYAALKARHDILALVRQNDAGDTPARTALLAETRNPDALLRLNAGKAYMELVRKDLSPAVGDQLANLFRTP